MIEWFSENLGTIIVTLLLIAVLAGAVMSLVRKKKRGESSCGCGCSSCALHGTCHKK